MLPFGFYITPRFLGSPEKLTHSSLLRSTNLSTTCGCEVAQGMDGNKQKKEMKKKKKKRVMVVIDQSSGAKQAMMWALTHVAHNGDLLTLLHVLHKHKDKDEEEEAAAAHLANSLVSLCKACKPEVIIHIITSLLKLS